MDPNDPSTIYITQPVTDESKKLAERPKYAANYGEDEQYEDMDAPSQAHAQAQRAAGRMS